MGVHPFLSAICSAQTLKRDSLPGWFVCTSVLISGSDLLKHWGGLTAWIGVHPFLSGVPICSNAGERLTAWMGVHPFWSAVLVCSYPRERTHFLNGCTSVLISGSNLHKKWRGTHILDGYTRSHQWFRSTLALKRDSQSGWVCTHSRQRF